MLCATGLLLCLVLVVPSFLSNNLDVRDTTYLQYLRKIRTEKK